MQILLRIHELDSTDQRKLMEDYVDHFVESIQGGCEICVGTNNAAFESPEYWRMYSLRNCWPMEGADRVGRS